MSICAQPKRHLARAQKIVQETLASLARTAKDAENAGQIQTAADIRAIYVALLRAAPRVAAPPDKHHAAPSNSAKTGPAKATACRVPDTRPWHP